MKNDTIENVRNVHENAVASLAVARAKHETAQSMQPATIYGLSAPQRIEQIEAEIAFLEAQHAEHVARRTLGYAAEIERAKPFLEPLLEAARAHDAAAQELAAQAAVERSAADAALRSALEARAAVSRAVVAEHGSAGPAAPAPRDGGFGAKCDAIEEWLKAMPEIVHDTDRIGALRAELHGSKLSPQGPRANAPMALGDLPRDARLQRA